MNFDQEAKDNYTLVSVFVPKLDATNSPELKALFVLLNKTSVANIVLDLSKSTYCDSSGLSAILIGNRLCKDAGGEFVLAGLQPNVRKLIEISQLHNVLKIVEKAEAAASHF